MPPISVRTVMFTDRRRPRAVLNALVGQRGHEPSSTQPQPCFVPPHARYWRSTASGPSAGYSFRPLPPFAQKEPWRFPARAFCYRVPVAARLCDPNRENNRRPAGPSRRSHPLNGLITASRSVGVACEVRRRIFQIALVFALDEGVRHADRSAAIGECHS